MTRSMAARPARWWWRAQKSTPPPPRWMASLTTPKWRSRSTPRRSTSLKPVPSSEGPSPCMRSIKPRRTLRMPISITLEKLSQALWPLDLVPSPSMNAMTRKMPRKRANTITSFLITTTLSMVWFILRMPYINRSLVSSP